jgi:hypothetical protein
MINFKIAVSADNHIRNSARSARIKSSVRPGLLSAVLLSAVSLLAAESAEDIKLPVGHRDWFHVNSTVIDKSSPLDELLGELHMVHVNSTGEGALKLSTPQR